jgi:hypothetical protein
MTSKEKVIEAFLSKMLDDQWTNWEDSESDINQIFLAALPYFKFPRVSLDINNDGEFIEELSNEEIQIIATYMKCEWLNREILTWERIKPLYEERDFSEANMLDKLYDALDSERSRALKLEALYYRSVKRSPWDYTRLAGG